nr:IS3 family transposase [Actinomyces procaprae]
MTRIYEFIHSEEGNYPIARGVPVGQGLQVRLPHDWLSRPESATAVRRRELAGHIRKIFDESDGTYGYRRVAATLDWQGVSADVDTVRSIMRELGLSAARPRRKVRTTVPAQDLDERPDLVQRDFTASVPGVKWVGDITYIPTWVGFVYLATVLDCCTKKVVGWALAGHMRTDLVCQAIDMAARNCKPTRGVTVFPFRPGQPVHLPTVRRLLEEVWYSAVGGAYRGVLG